ncbi:MAG: hypothetical protein JO165_04300, partial [Candidatus Eremiobacteraeota bacterium]|nr:hypothetical protein [Candidatus Eremiobacteraeota bacterium]
MRIRRSILLLWSVILASTTFAYGTTTQWTQYAYGAARTSYNPSETTLTAGNVSGLRLKWYAKLDSGALAQPLVAHSVIIHGVSKDVLYAATYYRLMAIDTQASDGGSSLSTIKVMWNDSFPGTYTSCLGTALHWGTWATPYIDRQTNRLYLVDGSRTVRAVDISTGASIPGWNLQLDPDPNNGVDGALSLNPTNHTLYAAKAIRCGLEQGSSPPVRGAVYAI